MPPYCQYCKNYITDENKSHACWCLKRDKIPIKFGIIIDEVFNELKIKNISQIL